MRKQKTKTNISEKRNGVVIMIASPRVEISYLAGLNDN